jgi:hypothetical protein
VVATCIAVAAEKAFFAHRIDVHAAACPRGLFARAADHLAAHVDLVLESDLASAVKGRLSGLKPDVKRRFSAVGLRLKRWEGLCDTNSSEAGQYLGTKTPQSWTNVC